MKIFIIGMPGAGKTSFAKKWANHIGWKHIDTDDLIEEKHELSVSQIIENMGEAFFRGQEFIIIDEINQNQKDSLIVSCGGGLPCFGNQMEVLLRSGLVIYLDTPLEFILRNLENETDKRPLLKGEKLKQLLEQIYKKRKGVYCRAHLSFVNFSGKTGDLFTKEGNLCTKPL